MYGDGSNMFDTEQLDEMIEELDTDGDGMIDYDELM